MINLKNILYSSVSLTGFILTVYSVGSLMLFVSNPDKTLELYEAAKNLDVSLVDILYSLLIDMSLLSLFIFQHTCMTFESYKQMMKKYNLNVIDRSIYNISTAVCLLALTHYWQHLYEYNIWGINASSGLLWWIFTLVHFLAWTIIYGGSLIMDITEILGIKQVYYNIVDLPDPMSLKSTELQRLYSHIRHPSFLGFLAIFWICPVMSLDRFVMSVVFSLYMIVAWNTDEVNYKYQESQLQQKRYTLREKIN